MINFLDSQGFMDLPKKPMQNLGTVIKVFFFIKKGIMNLSFKTLLLEMTVKQWQNYTLEKNTEKDTLEIIVASLKENKLIICMAEG